MPETKLKRWMKENGFIQRDICRIANLGSGTVSSLVNGKRIGSRNIYDKIAKAFGVSTSEISNYEEINNTPSGGRPKLNPRFIRSKMYEHGILQKDLAHACGITEPSFSAYMRGKSGPSMASLAKIASILCCSTEDLLLPKEQKPTGKMTFDIDIKSSRSEENTLPSSNPCDCAYTQNDSFNKKDPSQEENAFVEFPPVVVQKCEKCALDDTIRIQINSDMSYPTDVIRRWVRWSLCHMMNENSPEYDPIQAGKISDLFFRFFVNKKKPLREDCHYYVKEKKGTLYLKRDHEDDMTSRHEYIITRIEKDSRNVTRRIMTEAERRTLENVLNDLNIKYRIRDVSDIW